MNIFENIEIHEYPFKRGKVILKIARIKKDKYSCEINWDFGGQCVNNSNPTPINATGKYYQIQQHEIKNLIKNLNKIKRKNEKIKLLIASLLVVHQEISAEMFYQQKLF